MTAFNRKDNFIADQGSMSDSTMLSDVIDPASIIQFIKRRALVLATIVTMAIGAGYFYYTIADREYVARAEIIFEVPGSDYSVQNGGFTPMSIGDRAINTQVEVLRSTSLALTAIESNEELRAAIKDFYEEDGLVGEAANAGHMADARRISNNLTITRQGMTSVVAIQYVDYSPELAQKSLAALLDTYFHFQRDSKTDATEETAKVLQGRLSALRQEVSDAEQKVEEYKAKTGLLSTGDVSLEDRRLISLQELLAKARADRTLKELKLTRFRSESEEVSGQASAALLELQKRKNESERELAKLLQRYGQEHPSIVAAQEELWAMENQLQAERTSIALTMNDEVLVAKQIEAGLQQELDQVKSTIRSREADQVELRELERHAAASREVYENFLTTSKQLSESREFARADAAILEPALASYVPFSPKLSYVLLIAGFCGVVGGIGIGLLFDYRPDVIMSGAQLEKVTQVRNFGYIPEIKRGKGNKRRTKTVSDAVIVRPRSAYSEAINRLGVMLESSTMNHSASSFSDTPANNPILFTAAVSREGKSSTAISFARACVAAGERTVIIDGDLRRPSVANYVGAKVEVGLEDILLREAKLNRALIKDQHSDLITLPASGWYSRPTELLNSKAFKDLLNHLCSEFDRVIIDSPPVLAFPEAIVLGKLSAATIMVVRWRSTRSELVRDAMAQLKAGDANIAGAVLSRVNLDMLQNYGYYDSKYYVNENEFEFKREKQMFLPSSSKVETST